MRIGRSREGAFGGDGRRPVAVATPSRSASRALTILSAAPAREPAPQTRVKRRAEPAEALAAYRAVAGILS